MEKKSWFHILLNRTSALVRFLEKNRFVLQKRLVLERHTLKSTLEVSTNIAVLLVAVAALSTLAITVFLKPSAPNFLLGLEKGKAFGQVSNIDYGGSDVRPFQQ